MALAPEYIAYVLSDNFDDAKAILLSPLMAIHYAHLVMLADRGIISRADAQRLRTGLDSIAECDVRTATFDAACEDLFFHVERLLATACGEEIAGRLHTARSRNDIDMTMYRMWQRGFVLDLIQGTSELRRTLLALADRYRDTIYPAHTHTQPAQPSTIGHYLHAVVEQLERDAGRLRAAYESTNRNPLGACAITGTGFPIDRNLTSALLGFSGPTGNTYGSIATVDYLLESVWATGILVLGLGRVLHDLLLWCTTEVGALRLADGFVQSSSIMPQKRNPVALEHARAIASKALGQATAITQTVHNTPFGDIVDTEDDLQPLVLSMFRDASRAVRLVAAALQSATFDEARLLARAREGSTTMTELADTFVRDHGVAFRTSHAIVARLIADRINRPDEALGEALERASAAVLGEPLRYSEEALARIVSPEHFIAVRRTHGGPAPEELSRALAQSRTVLETDEAWSERARASLDDARVALRQGVEAL